MNQETSIDRLDVDFNAPLEQLRSLLAGQSAELRAMIAEAEQVGLPTHMQPDMKTIQASVAPDAFEQVQNIVVQVRGIDEELSARSATAGKLPHKVRNRI